MNHTEKQVHIRKNFWEDIERSGKRYVHIIMIATKPDIIKQAPLYLELKKRGELVVLIHTGQHYDYNLSHGVLGEFGMDVDINLNIYGKLHQKYSLIIERLGNILIELSEDYKKIPVPYVHGDTLTATTADKAAFLNKFSVVHVEAGIRTFTPKREFFEKLFTDYEAGKFEWKKYYKSLQEQDIYELGSIEPYPEQFDTRGVEPSAGYFALPHELYEKTLRREGFPRENMEVVGNTVSDAIAFSLEKAKNSKIYEYYPQLKGKKYIFVTIHRRENCEKKERFLTIFYAIKKLLERGVVVCMLGFYASEFATDNFGLREELDELLKKYPESFAYGKPLAHHHEAIHMIQDAGALVTDSGSMQEEANIVGTPCVTVRFGSDRSETILEGCNVLAPPINSELIADIVEGAISNKDMVKKNIYGKDVSQKIVNGVLARLHTQGKLFQYDDERLGLEKYFNWK
ncbi:UDP-N-acetylglucosamine 2-epimerase [Candidatus Gracilibacteria bacterium]|nr:UDP-N-acetylglucosamine 2-epimerase [Candidatus Gracilibacteria bacterium]